MKKWEEQGFVVIPAKRLWGESKKGGTLFKDIVEDAWSKWRKVGKNNSPEDDPKPLGLHFVPLGDKTGMRENNQFKALKDHEKKYFPRQFANVNEKITKQFTRFFLQLLVTLGFYWAMLYNVTLAVLRSVNPQKQKPYPNRYQPFKANRQREHTDYKRTHPMFDDEHRVNASFVLALHGQETHLYLRPKDPTGARSAANYNEEGDWIGEVPEPQLVKVWLKPGDLLLFRGDMMHLGGGTTRRTAGGMGTSPWKVSSGRMRRHLTTPPSTVTAS